MRINNFGNNNGIAIVRSNASTPGNQAASVSSASADSQDGVALSRLSQVLDRLRTDSSSNEQQIEELRNSFKSGSYSVDASSISRSIIDSALGFA